MPWRALPGFRDFYPAEMAVRRHIENAWHETARLAGFLEMEGPPLESLDLYVQKSGEGIVDELYAFTDKGGREVALRPEMTPTLGRMVAERAQALKKPVKWYSVPQLFRYDRPQRGRLREHVQWNVDILGASEVAADAELVFVAVDALRRLGLGAKDLSVRLNDRNQVRRLLADLDIEKPGPVLAVIDKVEKIEEQKARDLLAEAGVTSGAADTLLQWCRDGAPPGPDVEAFLQAAEEMGLRDFLEVDFKIVRGLAYYTGIVFEIFDRARSLRAIAGGGRYDGLVESLDGPAMPAPGFGTGDVVLCELLSERKLLPAEPARLDDYVLPIGETMVGPARQVATRLRTAGRRAEAPYAPIKMNKGFKAAEAAGALRVVLVGETEWAEGHVRIKTLADNTEQTVDLTSL